MSFLGVDVGTSGCKSAAYAADGTVLGAAYEEYDMIRPRPGWAELDPALVWERVRRTIATAARGAARDPVRALAVSSMGEAVVPVTADRRVLGPSILMNDARGGEYVPLLEAAIGRERLHRINGNALGASYSLPKLMWTRDHQPEVYHGASKFLPWSGFAAHLLGAEATGDWSLAGRTLLFDVEGRCWSAAIADAAGIERSKLPDLVAPGTPIGTVDDSVASELGLPRGVTVVAGCHDQCANGIGCGVVEAGTGMIGLGSWLCIMPVFDRRPSTATMLPLGLCTERHAAPGRFVTFLYNQGGLLLKWFRDTFARAERDEASRSGVDVYAALAAEVPDGPSSVLVLPHFTVTGPPAYVEKSSGAILGLTLETGRGDILKGIMEGTVFYHRAMLQALAAAGHPLRELRVVGGGARSDAWPRVAADVLGIPLVATTVADAGTLGAAIVAAAGCGAFDSIGEGVAAMVAISRRFDPDDARVAAYEVRYERYRAMWPALEGLLAAGTGPG